MRLLAIALYACFPVATLLGCGGGLTDDDKASTTHAAILSGMAYKHEDPATPAAALMRGSFCSSAAVLRRQKLAVPDAGITCDTVGP